MRPGILISSIALAAGFAVLGSASNEQEFRPGPATEYAHQTAFGVTVGAKPFNTQTLTAQAFGKKTPLLKNGVLPVLLVVENKSKEALDLRGLKANLVGSNGRHIRSINPEDVQYIKKGNRRPSGAPSPLPFSLHRKKNGLTSPEILTRAFTAEFVSPGDSVSGFLYFEAQLQPGDRIYLDGIRDVRSGNELMYYEFPLQQR